MGSCGDVKGDRAVSQIVDANMRQTGGAVPARLEHGRTEAQKTVVRLERGAGGEPDEGGLDAAE